MVQKHRAYQVVMAGLIVCKAIWLLIIKSTKNSKLTFKRVVIKMHQRSKSISMVS